MIINKKSLLRRIKALSLSLVMVCGMFVTIPVSADGNEIEGYIRIEDASKPDGECIYTEKYLYNYWGSQPEEYANPYEGLSYDKSNNTLTIKDYKNPLLSLFLDGMDTNFKIVLIGDNSIGTISSMRTGISIEGSGSLVINENKTEHTSGRMSGTTPPPFEVDKSYYVDSSIHIGSEAAVTFNSGDQQQGGNNLEFIWCKGDDISSVLSWDGEISEKLNYQTIKNEGYFEKTYINNDLMAYRSVSSELLYKDKEGKLYIKSKENENYYSYIEKHNDKWFTCPFYTQAQELDNPQQVTEGIPDDLLIDDGLIGVYAWLNSTEVANPEDTMFCAYKKSNKTYAIMPKIMLNIDISPIDATVTDFCLVEVQKEDKSFEINGQFMAPWTMDAGKTTVIAEVTNKKQAEEYMEANGYELVGYQVPTMYEFIIMNDVIKFTPKAKNSNPTPTATASPEKTQPVDPTPTPTATASPEKTPEVKKGTTDTDEKTGATYTVTKSENGKVEVEYKAPKSSGKKVTIPSKVEVNGVEAKVTSVSKNAFANNKKIEKVTIPSSVTKIGSGAFKNCAKLNTVTIPKGVTEISSNAFSGCKKLKTITVKSTSLKKVGKNAFKSVPKSATAKLPKKQKKAYKKLFKSGGYKGKYK
ncbi:Leucine rich repeat-containing protein [Lachnospiraceae bacterium]|nr:Leucine rich repeat-containing protein [Lachnospiraceae bacterium]